MLKGLEINLVDLRNDKQETYHYENGMIAFVEFINESRTPLHAPVYFNGSESNGIVMDVSFQFCEEYDENTLSFVNNVRTKDGGTHEVGLKTAFTKAFNDYARKI